MNRAFLATFAVVRTPLLPFSAPWNEDILSDPVVREAIYLASPPFLTRAAAKKSGGENGRGLLRTLYRYYSRMRSRPTPYGLFAGVTFANIGEKTCVELVRRCEYGRRSRLDFGVVEQLCDSLAKEKAVAGAVRFVPNTSIVERQGAFEYVESKNTESGKIYFRSRVEATPFLRAVLSAAKAGADLEQLCRVLVEGFAVERDEAAAYLEVLIANQILVTTLQPPLTGMKTLSLSAGSLRDELETIPRIKALEAVEIQLNRLDEKGIGAPLEEYSAIANLVAGMGLLPTARSLVQVDMVKPAVVALLGKNVIAEVLRGVGLLHRYSSPRSEGPLDTFRQRFLDRYGEREIPLLEALDEEGGIGFDGAEGSRSAQPLLDGLPLATRGLPLVPWDARVQWLFERWEDCVLNRLYELELQQNDEERFGKGSLDPLPDAFGALCVVAATDACAVDRGEFLLWLKAAAGPSGARLLGRFCHLDDRLEAAVRDHLRAEEAVNPQAVFAEIVHLPAGRIGNVVQRPVLRDYEIPYLGQSGATRERQISTQDLLVSVRDGRIVLRSRRLGREVVPRLTTAHNYASPRNLPVYRFLCMLQRQGVAGELSWKWGPLETAAFLPRVRCGRIVLARARWLAKRRELVDLSNLHDEGSRFDAVNRWRETKRMPRFVYLTEGDNELLVDFEDRLAVDVFLEEALKKSATVITEMFPTPDNLWVSGPEGKFAHELVIPFVRTKPGVDRRLLLAREDLVGSVTRKCPPGSEWLYAKLYCGEATADHLLIDTIAPFANDLVASGAITRWFFVRYRDPEWHLRVRFFGEPKKLRLEVLPTLEKLAQREIERGRCWKFQLDTYEREVERYGGDEAILAAEEMFFADSIACCQLLPLLLGDERAGDRWRVALLGIHYLLEDLGLSPPAKIELAGRLRDAFQAELGWNQTAKKNVAKRFRKERAQLEKVFLGEGMGEPYVSVRTILGERSGRWREATAKLKNLAASNALTRSLVEIAGSLTHMHVNRLLRAEHRALEAVLYHFLFELFRSFSLRAWWEQRQRPEKG